MSRPKKRKLRVQSQELIAERVREEMARRGLGQKAMAEQLAVSEGYFSRILSGHRPWTVQLLLQAARALEVSVDSLDPDCMPMMEEAIQDLELQDAQLSAFYMFIQKFPRIDSPEDLEALAQIIHAFAHRRAQSSAAQS